MIRRNAVVGLSVGILGIAGAVGAGCAKDASAVNPPDITQPGFPNEQPQPTSIGPKPQFGPTHTEATPVPPISGGTLIVAKDGVTALASDPDRDQVYVVDLTKGVSTTIALQTGDEPGRLVEDGAQRVHVVLRKSGALLTVDIASAKIIARQQVCSAPRGVAYEAGADAIYVACAGGELVKLAAAGGAAPAVVTVHDTNRSAEVMNDLRDVVTFAGRIFVTRLRSAELLEVDSIGTVLNGAQKPPPSSGMEPAVAWRTVLVRDPLSGSPQLAMVHQRARQEPVSVQPGGYGQSSGGDPSCESSIVESTVTRFGPSMGETSQMPSPIIPSAVLPVDIAVSADNSWMAVVAAGNGHTKSLPDIMLLDTNAMAMNSGGFGCTPGPTATSPGQATAVAFDGRGHLIVQTREPASLSIINVPAATGTVAQTALGVASQIVLSTVSREDTGHSIFHSNAGGFVACASCHAEGGDDGRTWTFTDSGARRTQSLRGTLEGTAPYHWDGNMKDLPMLSHEVFVKRMSGDELAGDQVGALETFLFSMPVPAVSPAKDSAQVARGQALFNDANVGCNGCHSGPKLTNNATVDVGTGGQFQVPSLVGVGMRAPYLHTGSALTLQDRFDSSIGGGDKHGHTSQLTSAQVDDLVAFLGTL